MGIKGTFMEHVRMHKSEGFPTFYIKEGDTHRKLTPAEQESITRNIGHFCAGKAAGGFDEIL